MIRNRFFLLGFLSLALIISGIAAYYALKNYVLSQTGPTTETQFLYIKPGSGLLHIASSAQRVGLVGKVWHFSLAARLTGTERALKAGEYKVGAGTQIDELLHMLREGQTHLRRVSIPEGYSVLEIEQLLQNTFGLETSQMALPEEGSILPETYFYSRGESADQLIKRMKDGMASTVAEAWKNRAEGLPLTSPYQAVVLASIVEKETGLAEERPQIAAVFLNRLRKKMRLQSDPTVIYGITSGLPLGRPIRRSDLREETAFNTYRISGLPPTPITNPGKAAIEAVLNPADVPYLYFVADGKGGHAFAETLKDHNANVRVWRNSQKNRAQ